MDLRDCCSLFATQSETHDLLGIAHGGRSNRQHVEADDIRTQRRRHNTPLGALDWLHPGCCGRQRQHRVMIPDRVWRRHRRPDWAIAAAGPNQNHNQNHRQMWRPCRPECAGPILSPTYEAAGSASLHFACSSCCHGSQAAPCPTGTATAATPLLFIHAANTIYAYNAYTKRITCPAGNRIQSPSLAAPPGLPWRNQQKHGFHHRQVPPSPPWQPHRDATGPASSSSLLQRRQGG